MDGVVSPAVEQQAAPTTRFRFKRKSSEVPSQEHHDTKRTRDDRYSTSSSQRDNTEKSHDSSRPKHPSHRSRRHRHHHHHHHHRKRDKNAAQGKDVHEADRPPSLSPETAFRESLFDAMADDEGAAFWEGVYGQPLHVYGEPTNSTSDPHEADGVEDKLQGMTEEEYVAYVRQKMWEKTHEGLLEERRQREEARQRSAAAEREREELHRRIGDSLRFGEERRRRKLWKDAWARYNTRWEGLGKLQDTPGDVQIPWPTQSGDRRDVLKKDEVFRFFEHRIFDGEECKGHRDWLKKERIRWHPDKMQSRLRISSSSTRNSSHEQEHEYKQIMKGVTAVFQILDDMWTSSTTTKLNRS